MSEQKRSGALLVPNPASEPIVAFYLIQETDLPAIFQGFHVVTTKIADSSGKQVKKPALRVTFSHDQSIEELVGLVAFGCDPRCYVQLPAGVVSSVHCKVYAQINSSPLVWLVEDSSIQGTQVKDEKTARNKLIKTVHGCRQAVQGLYAINIGPYVFQIQAPVSKTEIRRREEWFRLHKPVPVTRSMLDRQLDGLPYNWLRMDPIGNGGFGEVYRYMENSTALYVAVKEEELGNPAMKLKVEKEVNYMECLRHVSSSIELTIPTDDFSLT